MIVEGMGLIHPVMSYCGDLTIAFTSCREMLPDPAFYARASATRSKTWPRQRPEQVRQAPWPRAGRDPATMAG